MPSFLKYLGAAAPLIAGGLGFLGARGQNSANREVAQNQMNFQQDMSSTAYQRSMADMEKAGLNPMLAYQQGGASSPVGASIAQQNELGPLVNSAVDVRRSFAELANMKAQRSKINSDTDLNRALINVARQDALIKNSTAKVAEADAASAPVMKKINESKMNEWVQWIKRGASPLTDFFKKR